MSLKNDHDLDHPDFPFLPSEMREVRLRFLTFERVAVAIISPSGGPNSYFYPTDIPKPYVPTFSPPISGAECVEVSE